MSAHSHKHMSPAQAAQVSGVSRWTIMRAIKSQDLPAFRDNRNQWQIKGDDLDIWLSAHSAHDKNTVQKIIYAHDVHSHTHHNAPPTETLELVRVQAELEAEKRLREIIEKDRDHWRDIAQKLTEPRFRKWWFW